MTTLKYVSPFPLIAQFASEPTPRHIVGDTPEVAWVFAFVLRPIPYIPSHLIYHLATLSGIYIPGYVSVDNLSNAFDYICFIQQSTIAMTGNPFGTTNIAELSSTPAPMYLISTARMCLRADTNVI
jgi:hypothetical protein